MPAIFLRLKGKVPSIAAMQSFIDDSYVPNDGDMECWSEGSSRSEIRSKLDYIGLFQYRDDENFFRLRSESRKLLYQLGYFLAVSASGALSLKKEGNINKTGT